MKKLAIILILIDQLIKNVIRFTTGFDEEIFNSFGLTVLHFKNTEALSTNPVIQFFVIILLILIFKFLFELYQIPIFVPLIIAGVLSNLFDGIIFSSVIDYIRILKSPIFNLADVYIIIGLLIVIYKIWGKHYHLKKMK